MSKSLTPDERLAMIERNCDFVESVYGYGISLGRDLRFMLRTIAELRAELVAIGVSSHLRQTGRARQETDNG